MDTEPAPKIERPSRDERRFCASWRDQAGVPGGLGVCVQRGAQPT